MDVGTSAAVGVVKSAAEILAEIGDSEHPHPDLDPNRPLKQPGKGGYWVRKNRYPLQRKPREYKVRLCELVPGCTKVHVGLGGCQTHWYRLRRYGDPLAGNFTRANRKDRESRGGG